MPLRSLFLTVVLVWLAAPVDVSAAIVLNNQLDNHASPYLAMHGDDPVDWQDWRPGLLERTRKENRLLFISSGYFSCHWCHVMQRESYQSEEVARLLNEQFLPVKIDRELEPALDAQLIEFVRLTRGQAGWPLNVILTPDGYPLLGFTYLPKQRFYTLLKELSERWQQEPEKLAELARKGTEEIISAKQQVVENKAKQSLNAVQAFIETSREIADDMSGGFGQQNKFPMVVQLQQLIKLTGRDKSHALAPFVRLTLDQMASLGMRDHLGEGFFRYSTVPDWTIPHFEKMLYDNAQLASLYLQAGKQLNNAGYLQTGYATLDFILEQMAGEAGGYVSSFSAVDDQGREGFYYTWTHEQLEKQLAPDELKAATAYWSLGGHALSEYGFLPIRVSGDLSKLASTLRVKPAELEQQLKSARTKLLQARRQRSLPVDDKQLAAWNGLVLSALARAYQLSNEQRYKSAGNRLAEYLSKQLWKGGQLLRATGRSGELGQASVEDYALVARGLRDWSEVETESSCLQLSNQLTTIGWKKYFRANRWYQSDKAVLPGLGGSIALPDNSLPSASAVLTRLALTSKKLAADRPLQKKVRTHLDSVRQFLVAELFWYAGYVDLLNGSAEK